MEQKRFTDIFIERPVLATVLSLIILVLGFESFHLLPLRQFPLLQTNVININVTYPGANPELVESFITTPIENALTGIEGVDYISSASSQGSSNITIYFVLGYDINKANTTVSNAVSSVRYRLPKAILDPVITQQDPNSQATVYLSFASAFIPEIQISDYLDRVIRPQLANLPSVGRVDILSNMYAMRLWLDPQKMAAQGITATDVNNAIQSNNVQGALGQLQAPYQYYTIVGNTDLKDADQFNQLVVKVVDGKMIRLKDIGQAELGAQSYTSSASVNGVRTGMLSITPTSLGNPIDLSNAVNKLLPSIQAHLPSGMKVTSVWDSSKFIRASLKEVVETFIIALFCVLVVIFLFLGSWRAIIIPVVTIPLSIFGVSSIMLLLHYSLNTLTFLAWVLAIGLVVDDAIVVLENISRHVEEGKPPFEAALFGAREIAFAVIAMTLTLAAVYAPIGMMSDITGVLFREFAFTLASAVIISGFIALTLSPMMCSRILRPIEKQSFTSKVDVIFHALAGRYQKILVKVLAHPRWVVVFAVVIYTSAIFLYKTLPSELAPTEDQGVVVTIMRGPTSANLDYMQKYTARLSQIFNTVPERENYGIINGWPTGVNSGIAFLVLKPWGERKRNADEIIGDLMPKLWGIPGILAFPFNPPALPGTSGNNSISLVLKSTGSWDDLAADMAKLQQIAHKNPNIVNVDTDLQRDQLQLNVLINRNKANSLGVNMDDLANSMNVLLGDPIAGYFERQGKSYQIIPQVYEKFRQEPQQLSEIPVRTLTGGIIPLGSFVDFQQVATPQSLPHFQQMRAVTLSASVAPGYTLGEALDFLNAAIAKDLPASVQVDYSGQSRQFIESKGAMGQVFLMAVIFIFLVLAAQFESFRNPFVVMLSVPLSLFGALLIMHFTRCTMNIFTEIGLVTLVGLISKHAILIVEFAEQIQATGKSVFDAVLESASLRLRPILMTTAAMVLGAIPLILANGAGSEARRQLGWVIVAGMGIGTCFTLFVIPTVYSLIAKKADVKSR